MITFTRADHGLCCKQVERDGEVAARSLERGRAVPPAERGPARRRGRDR